MGGKNANVPGIIEEIAGPADSRPYMQKVEYILADHGGKENSASNSVETKKFVQSADSAVYLSQVNEKKYTNVQRQEAWYLEVIKIRFNLLSLKRNCLKEKIIVMDSHLKGDLYDVIHALLDYCGAVYKISVTKKTEYCVVSEEYKNGGTGNSDRAIRYRKQGVPLEILTTDEFFALLRELNA